MGYDNKAILMKANALVSQGDHEGFLALSADDVVWEFVGDRVLQGKEAVRAYMKEVYVEPPVFDVHTAVAEGDHVTVIGKISLNVEHGSKVDYEYCDVWKFRDGMMAELKAFVIAV
jgi:uncharacterized protein